MSAAVPLIRGIIRGKTVELERESGLAEGQQVVVTLQPAENHSKTIPGEGLRQAFGAWADDEHELDEFLRQVRRDRNTQRPDLEP